MKNIILGYYLGILIGSRYSGLCCYDWDYCIFDVFNTYLNIIFKHNKEILYNCIEYCNCGNGKCMHNVNITSYYEKY